MSEPEDKTTITRRRVIKSLSVGAVSTFGTLAYGRFDTQHVELNKHELKLDRWTKPNFRIGFLSDTHLTDDWAIAATQKALDLVIAERPDIIVFGGDFVESSLKNALWRMEKAFAALKTCGIPALAISGNHDLATAVPNRVFNHARACGFQVLRNRIIEWQGITFVGIESLYDGPPTPALYGHLKGKDNVVVLYHEPDGVKEIDGVGSIMLSGHSHGGQICLPGGVSLHTPPGARAYIRGFYPDAPTPLFVSRGVGVTGLRIRLFCAPEANIFTLNPRSA